MDSPSRFVLLTACVLILIGGTIAGIRYSVLNGNFSGYASGPFQTVSFSLEARLRSPQAYVKHLIPSSSGAQQVFQQPFSSSIMSASVRHEGLELNSLAYWDTIHAASSAVIYSVCNVSRIPGLPLSPDITPEKRDQVLQYYLRGTENIQSFDHRILTAARSLATGATNEQETISAIFRFCSDTIAGISVPGSYDAVTCLTNRAGDCGAKSRLMVALCRAAGFPARTVGGLIMTPGRKKTTHVWVEVLQGLRWVPFCPLNHYFGSVPDSYLLIYRGDYPLLRFKYIDLVDYYYECVPGGDASQPGKPSLRSVFGTLSFNRLSTSKQWIIRTLLLIPLGALMVCFMRNMIGIPTIGTFTPVLIALGIHMIPLKWGVSLLVIFILLGLLMRWLIDSMKLLLVPRLSVMLTVVVCGIITVIVFSDAIKTQYGAFFVLLPVVIMTMSIERCWLLELEDGFYNMFIHLAGTITVLAVIYGVFRVHLLTDALFNMPELLCVVIALMLLIGRYTGFRLTEYFRFMALAHEK